MTRYNFDKVLEEDKKSSGSNNVFVWTKQEKLVKVDLFEETEDDKSTITIY